MSKEGVKPYEQLYNRITCFLSVIPSAVYIGWTSAISQMLAHLRG
jgi:hypothetical protein